MTNSMYSAGEEVHHREDFWCSASRMLVWNSDYNCSGWSCVAYPEFFTFQHIAMTRMEVDEWATEMEDAQVSGPPFKRGKTSGDSRTWQEQSGIPRSRPKMGLLNPLLKGKKCRTDEEDHSGSVLKLTPRPTQVAPPPRIEMLETNRTSLTDDGPKVRIPDLCRKKMNPMNPFKVKAENDPRATSTPQHRARKLLPKNEEVYVRLEDNGLHGSWHRAKIQGVKPRLRLVQFHDLEEEETGKALREWVQFGMRAPRGRVPGGTRLITDGKSLLRPAGPGNPPNEPSFRSHGGWPRNLWVEVCESNTWWEGVLEEDATEAMIKDDFAFADVRYPLLGHIVEEVQLRDVRVCKDWNQETGEWTIRGKYNEESDRTHHAMHNHDEVMESL